MSAAGWYRGTGATAPFGDLLGAHGVAVEGYYWRVTDPDTGRVVIALIGVNQGPRGPWATVGFARYPQPFVSVAAVPEAWADPVRLGARAGDAFTADAGRVRLAFGGAELDLRIDDPIGWPRRRFGGSSWFQVVPRLNQYWHPWLLGGRASGHAVVDGERWEFTGAQVYGEKNWGAEGFPEAWWWGQAQGFADREACVAFAGGLVTAGPLRTTVTGLVVRLPDRRVLRLGNPVTSPVRTRTTDDTWALDGRGSGWQVTVRAIAPLARAFILPVPLPSQNRNVAGDLEHLVGDLTVSVRRGGRLIWQGESRLACLEHGSLSKARAEVLRRGLPPETTAAAPSEPSPTAALRVPVPGSAVLKRSCKVRIDG